jgi:catechol 2,3-dioxygenase-like lactoylglutathione lyase family enzyme
MTLGSASIIGFIATNDGARAKTFYADTLGLPLVADEPFALVLETGGTMLRIQKVRDWTPPPFTVFGWAVRDIVDAVDELAARGVEFVRVGGIPQDERGIWRADARTQVAWFKDPDGNTLSLTQFDGEVA